MAMMREADDDDLGGYMRRCDAWVVLFGSAVLMLHGCAMLQPRSGAERSLPHFVQVDDGLYRGAQPSSDGVRQLARLGIKTIVSLRRPSRVMKTERALAEELGIQWVNIPIFAWWRPSEAQIRQFLTIVTDPQQRPVFVHCRFGRNRTGVMVAVYRITQQGWLPARAYTEGRRLGLFPLNLVTRDMIFRRIPRTFAPTVARSSPSGSVQIETAR